MSSEEHLNEIASSLLQMKAKDFKSTHLRKRGKQKGEKQTDPEVGTSRATEKSTVQQSAKTLKQTKSTKKPRVQQSSQTPKVASEVKIVEVRKKRLNKKNDKVEQTQSTKKPRVQKSSQTPKVDSEVKIVEVREKRLKRKYEKVQQKPSNFIDESSEVTEKISKSKTDKVKKGNITKKPTAQDSPQRISTSRKQKAKQLPETLSKQSKKPKFEKVNEKMSVKGKEVAVEKKKTRSKKHQLADEKDSDFESHVGPSKKQKTNGKVVKKGTKVPVVKEFNSMKSRCSPGALLAIIQGLSMEQKECVREMGFGSLLRMKLMDIPLKLGFYVLEHFNAETLKVNVENGELNVNTKSVHEMLGLPTGGTLLSDMDLIDEDDEKGCMFEWKKQFEKWDMLRLKQLKNELLRTTKADFNFKINFLVLFINTFCESTSMGRCNLSPLFYIRRDTDIRSIDWCNYIVDCLIRTKNLYNPEKETSFFFGPAAYLVLLYVDGVKFKHLQVTRRRPTIYYWTSEKIRFREDTEQDEGGFGSGELNEAYVEHEGEESDEYEEECEHEGEKDGDKYGSVEGYETKITNMYKKMECLKEKVSLKIDEAISKFPENETLKSWKSRVSNEDTITKRFDFHFNLPAPKGPILIPVYNDRKGIGENEDEYDDKNNDKGNGNDAKGDGNDDEVGDKNDDQGKDIDDVNGKHYGSGVNEGYWECRSS